MFEQRLLRDFAQRLDVDVRALPAELDGEIELAWAVALLQAAMGIISDTGAAATDDLCPHQDTEGRDRCKVVTYSIDEEENRFLLFTTHHLPGQLDPRSA